MSKKIITRIAELIGLGIHTSLRKYCKSEASHKAWSAIGDIPNDEWSYITYCVAEEVIKLYKKLRKK